MRRIVLLAFAYALLLNNHIYAQTGNLASPYLFPEFVNATVLQKNGAKMQAKMNYQKVTEEMLFIQDGKKIVLGNPEVVDTVYIGVRKFVPARAVFIEKITDTRVALYTGHKAKLSSASAKSENRVDNGNNKKTIDKLDVYELIYPADYEVKSQEIYWINHGLEYIPVQDIKKIIKAFPEKSKSINDFIESNKIKLSDKEDLIKLVTFLSR